MSLSKKEFFFHPYQIAEGSLAARDNADNIRFVVGSFASAIILAVSIVFTPIMTSQGLLENTDHSFFWMLAACWRQGFIVGAAVTLATLIIPIYGIVKADYIWRALSVNDPKFKSQILTLKWQASFFTGAAFFSLAAVIGFAQSAEISLKIGAYLLVVSIFSLSSVPIYVFVVGKEVLRAKALPAEVASEVSDTR